MTDAEGQEELYTTENAPVADLPVAVLIDEGTASSAEILAAAVVESGQGTTIGVTTFGTGTVLNAFDLSDGSMIYLGTGLWSTASGQVVWKVGLEPQFMVELESPRDRLRPRDGGSPSPSDLLWSDDTQLQAAIDWLAEGA